MEHDNLRFAFAVNQTNNFEAVHFGDAHKFLIYEFYAGNFHYIEEHENTFKTIDEEVSHGSQKKGESIIQMLDNIGVDILVSQQFGRNIQMVNKRFIPVIIRNHSPEEVLTILSEKIHWLYDEHNLKPEEHKLFTIHKGIMKKAIKHD